jgi:hypothetical protein
LYFTTFFKYHLEDRVGERKVDNEEAEVMKLPSWKGRDWRRKNRMMNEEKSLTDLRSRKRKGRIGRIGKNGDGFEREISGKSGQNEYRGR